MAISKGEIMIQSKMTIFITMALVIGCAHDKSKKDDFFTSGNREADQRAEQRVAKEQQIQGKGEGDGKAVSAGKKSLFDRLGGEHGLGNIVDDFVNRALA